MNNEFSAPSGRTDRSAITDDEFFDDLGTMVREFRIWHTGLGALALLFCGLMVLGGISLMFLGGSSGGQDASVMFFLGTIYIGMAVFYAIPGGLLMRSGIAAMQVFSGSQDREPILTSIRSQLWLWRVVGVLTFAVTLLYMGFLGLMVLGGMALSGL